MRSANLCCVYSVDVYVIQSLLIVAAEGLDGSSVLFPILRIAHESYSLKGVFSMGSCKLCNSQLFNLDVKIHLAIDLNSSKRVTIT